MKKYILITVCSVIAILQSCSEYLEETNPNFLSTANYWVTLDESDANLTSVYGAMLDQYVIGTEYEFLRSDIAYPGQRTRNVGQYAQWHEQRLNADERFVSRLWESKYRVIWRANQVINGLNNMSDDLKAQDRWTEQMGQARLFRGLMHFYLHALFNNGEIMIVDESTVFNPEFGTPVSSSEDVIAFFRADLQYAYENLPPQMEPRTRVDAGTAAATLGMSYLYEGEYINAMEYFNDIINNVNGDYGYQLAQDVSNMFTNTDDFNAESIFEINYADNVQLEDGNFDEESFFNRLARRMAPTGRNLETRGTFGGQGWLVPSAWLTFGLSNETMDTQDPRNFIDGDINGTMRNVPLRASQSIAVVNDEQSIYYGFTAPQVYAFGGTRFSLFKKFTNHDIVTREFDTNTTGWKSGKNVPVLRMGEIYIKYAECLAQIGDIPSALMYINEVRKRWGLQLLGPVVDSNHDYDGIAYTQSSLMDHIMYKESPFELAMEGMATRVINLRRWNIAAQRYQDLSTQVFSLANYTYTRTNGRTASRNRSLIQEGSGGNEFTEFGQAADSWSRADLGYFPLPATETLYNPSTN